MTTATDQEPTRTAPEHKPEPAAPQPRTVSIRLSTVLLAAAIAGLLIATTVFAGLYWSARSTLADRDARAADDRHAEQIATDYAVGASTIDFHDVKSWITRLQAGTTPQLSAKFDATAPQLEQILLPLQWTSKATPLSAAVTSESGGIYKVNAYLNVNSTSAQTPDGAQTTVTYSLTIDRNAGWKITDVGGLQNALPTK
ncbi:hypothetical protein [Nocardia wallacei]|uniref:Mce-associated membrane protein n=1 Tax=Nocardia wallacei TaxID=480035 RepID=A0A7G1KS78_9NOCA|nr:hypothetical protein [Nocardia wallacei]BCK58002.1 hypothetical protein NWFMUON74_57740 [Nocardia wallacei]